MQLYSALSLNDTALDIHCISRAHISEVKEIDKIFYVCNIPNRPYVYIVRLRVSLHSCMDSLVSQTQRCEKRNSGSQICVHTTCVQLILEHTHAHDSAHAHIYGSMQMI